MFKFDKNNFDNTFLFFIDYLMLNLWKIGNNLSMEYNDSSAKYRCNIIDLWATTWQNVSSGVSDQARHKPACAATEAS